MAEKENIYIYLKENFLPEGRDGEAAADPEAMRAECIREYEERFLNPYVAASRGFVDEVIHPEETRERLLSALKAFAGKEAANPKKKHGNIPL